MEERCVSVGGVKSRRIGSVMSVVWSSSSEGSDKIVGLLRRDIYRYCQEMRGKMRDGFWVAKGGKEERIPETLNGGNK